MSFKRKRDFVRVIDRPVMVERPAFDFFVKSSFDETCWVYHFVEIRDILREAFEFAFKVFRNKIKFTIGNFSDEAIKRY